jgi:anti-sigma factor RsiW
MNAQTPDHSTYREWLYLELDGALNSGQRSQLRDHLVGCVECQREQRELIALDELVIASRVDVRSDFCTDVMASLPTATWESRNPKSWVAAIAAVALLLLGSGALIATAGESLGSMLTLATVFSTVAELLRSSVVAGAGLLGASWKGLGLAFQEVLSGSIWNLIAVGTLVVAVDVLLIRLLRRREPSALKADTTDRLD